MTPEQQTTMDEAQRRVMAARIALVEAIDALDRARHDPLRKDAAARRVDLAWQSYDSLMGMLSSVVTSTAARFLWDRMAEIEQLAQQSLQNGEDRRVTISALTNKRMEVGEPGPDGSVTFKLRQGVSL